MTRSALPTILLALAFVPTGCAPTDPEQGERPPFAELVEDQGLGRHLGAAEPSEMERMDGFELHRFDVEDGPICMDGSPFKVMVRPGTGEGLTVFLQGGGACWSETCLAVFNAPDIMPILDITDPERDNNPWADDNLVYVPYCDGSLFVGDTQIDDDGDGTIDIHQRGLLNMSAALDLAVSRFPEPDRVLFAGASGGAYGTLLTTPLVRTLWPDTPIDVLNDAGVGIARGGDPGFVEGLVEELNATGVLPPDCPECVETGHVTPLVTWQLDQDPNLRVALISSVQDYVIGEMFLGLDPDVFEVAVREQYDAVEAAHPDRVARMLYSGSGHTTTLGDIRGAIGDVGAGLDVFLDLIGIGTIDDVHGGVKVSTWLTDFADGEPVEDVVVDD